MMEALNRLVDQAKSLADKVSALALSVDQLDRRTSRSEKITVGVVLGLLLDLVLSVAVAVVLTQLFVTNDRLEASIQREGQTRQEVLCPLYELIVSTFNPESRPPGPARDQYVQSMQVIIDSYPRLDCANPVTPGSAVAPR
jgi:hypothetical protein